MTLDPTRPHKVDQTQSTATAQSGKERAADISWTAGRLSWRRLRWFPLVFLVLLAFAGIAGYMVGIQQRAAARQQAIQQQARQQFELGVEDLAAGRHEIARQRFEYVIRIDPGYPGAPERLAEALLVLNQPTARPTPAVTPTPNLAPVEDLFDQAKEALAAGDWTTAIDTLVLLRSKDRGFQAVRVDGMLYAALRNRGVERIAEEGLLEEGIYDLSRARQFGPLDRDASNWKSWADLYLLANSYFGVNWGQAVAHFAEVYRVAPYLKNDAYIKYAIAAQNYAEQLAASGDACAAEELYDESLLTWDNATAYPTATEVHNLCLTATAPAPRPTQPETDTPTPGPTPTPEVTATPTPEDGGS